LGIRVRQQALNLRDTEGCNQILSEIVWVVIGPKRVGENLFRKGRKSSRIID